MRPVRRRVIAAVAAAGTPAAAVAVTAALTGAASGAGATGVSSRAAAAAASPSAPAPFTIAWRDSTGFVPPTAAPSFGAPLVFANQGLSRLTIARTATPGPSFVITLQPAGSATLALPPNAEPTPLTYTGDKDGALVPPVQAEHRTGLLLVPTPVPGATSPAATSAAAPATTAAVTRPPSKKPAATSPAKRPSHPSGSAKGSGSASVSAVAAPPAYLPASEMAQAAPIASGPPPALAPEPTQSPPVPSTPPSPTALSLPSAAPSSTAPPVVQRGLAGASVPARHRGLPIVLAITLLVGVGSALGRVVRGIRRDG
jgi:hypothetical protein